MTTPRYSNGWILVGWTALFTAILTGFILASGGFSEKSFHGVLIATARISALLFLGAFFARPLFQIWKSALSGWLLRNRRYLGVSFAASHTFHLAAIVWLTVHFPAFRDGLKAQAVFGGGLGYIFLYAMTATSFDRTARRLGSKAWKALHTTGLYYLWFIFFFTYLGNFFRSWIHGLFAVIFAAAMLFRWGVRWGVQTYLAPDTSCDF
jgi:methionine sulfoxide reductase heme-binding subunit